LFAKRRVCARVCSTSERALMANSLHASASKSKILTADCVCRRQGDAKPECLYMPREQKNQTRTLDACWSIFLFFEQISFNPPMPPVQSDAVAKVRMGNAIKIVCKLSEQWVACSKEPVHAKKIDSYVHGYTCAPSKLFASYQSSICPVPKNLYMQEILIHTGFVSLFLEDACRATSAQGRNKYNENITTFWYIYIYIYISPHTYIDTHTQTQPW
jgi:hypothetical protein